MASNCFFCKKRIVLIDWRDSNLIKFLSPWAKIKSRRYSHNCAKHQRQLNQTVKTARIMGVLPFVSR